MFIIRRIKNEKKERKSHYSSRYILYNKLIFSRMFTVRLLVLAPFQSNADCKRAKETLARNHETVVAYSSPLFEVCHHNELS